MMTTTRRSTPLRVRMVIAIVLAASVGFIAVIVATITIQRSALVTDTNAAIAQEVEEFRSFAEHGLDPDTGEPFTDPEVLLDTFLARQRVGEGEVLLGYVDGLVLDRRGPRAPGLQEMDFLAHEELLDEVLQGSAGVMDTPAGWMRWGRVAIDTPAGDGHFVVMHFTDVKMHTIARQAGIMIPVGLASLLLTGVIAWVLVGRLLRPLLAVQRTASRISDRELSERLPVRGDGELDNIALAFNAMLDRLEEAFNEQKRFVDDAGHELRTPITIIRGHLELMGDDPQERATTMALVNSELDRVGRIVSDLLALAKADRADYVRIPEEPVDVAELTMELDAHVQPIADRVWMVNHVADGPARIDEERITQAVLQLAQNAVQHTSEGQQVVISSRFTHGPDGPRDPITWVGSDTAHHRGEPGWVEFSVADSGSGLPAGEDPEKLFTRFSRGSAPSDTTGAGLGLAIVKAIVDGHGGTVGVSDTAGGGATFTLAVPRRLSQEQQEGSDPVH